MRTLGIDEAGRGCVLGPLVVGAFVVDDPDDDALSQAGADDSKKLSPARRLAAMKALADLGRFDTRAIGARQIDMGNLNTLEEAAIADLARTHRADVLIVDALGHPSTLPATTARLRAAIGRDVEIIMEPKADARYPIVGAASIGAKTTRDAALDALRESWGVLGSGYPSDPKTRAWLEQHAASGAPWPAFVRTRWETVRRLSQLTLG